MVFEQTNIKMSSFHLTRRLVYAGQGQIIKKPNCFSKNAKLLLTLKETKEKYNEIEKKLIGRVLAKDVYYTDKVLASQGQDICKYLVKKIIKAKKIYIRTPLNCKLNTGICQLCYGWNLATGRLADLAENVGIIAAQSIGEPGTQLTMRTFHTGGVYSSSRKIKETICSPSQGIINYNVKRYGKKLKTKYGENIFFTLKEKRIVISENKINKTILSLPKYTLIFVKPNQKVYKNQIIAEFPDTEIEDVNKNSYKEEIKIKTPISGIVESENKQLFKKRNSLKDEKRIWLIVGTILPYGCYSNNIKYSSKNEIKLNFNNNYKKNKGIYKDFNPRLQPVRITYKLFKKLPNFNNKYKKFKKVRKEYIVIKNLQDKKEILFTNNNEKWIEIKNINQVIIKLGGLISKKQRLTKKIINQYCSKFIQVRKNKICVVQSTPFFVTKNTKTNFNNTEVIHSNSEITFEKYTREKAEDIIQGLPKVEQLLEARKTLNLKVINNNPHQILEKEFVKLSAKYENSIAVRKTFEKIQYIIVERIQKVYKAQGVNIADKHLELIVKQMTSRVMITENEASNLMTGEIIETTKIEKINKKLKNKVKYAPILIGISKISLSNSSFLSEASFQETTRVLTKSAIEGKIDWLYGLKENVILGNLIPAGTGYKYNYL
jgi:DNA-directed RNA polymerase subunit beta'